MGSLAFAAAARAVWGITLDPDDKAHRLFIPVKMNLAADDGGLAYHVEEGHNGIVKVIWESGPVIVDVNTVMGGFDSHEDHSERREATEWLRDFLADGPRAATDVRSHSRTAGLTWITVRRAADSLCTCKRKIGGRGAGWEWSLQTQTKDAHAINLEVSTFEQAAEIKRNYLQSPVNDAHANKGEHLCPVSTFKEGEI
jgi:hypothetical protein